jgi:hypothetical protein
MVWVAVGDQPGTNQLLAFDNDGNLKKSIPLGDRNPFHVSVDAVDGTVWLTLFRHAVHCYGADGKLEAEHKLHALAAQTEPRSGGAWVVTPEETVLLSRKGESRLRVKHKGKTSQAWIAGW